MAEPLSSRVKRLVSGSANLVVTAVENLAPEMVMEEAIREIDEAIDDVRGELGQVMTRQYHASRRLAGENKRHEELSESIALAIGEKRDDLAEAGVERLLDVEAQIPVLDAVIAETRDAQVELEGFVTALQARRRQMQEDLREYRAARKTAASDSGDDGGAGGPAKPGVQRRIENATGAFDRALESGGGVGIGGAAPDRKSAAREAELESLARRNRIQERLAQIKSQG